METKQELLERIEELELDIINNMEKRYTINLDITEEDEDITINVNLN